MATVVLSYAGAALGAAFGGPVGSSIGRALGGIAGNYFDQQIFGPGPSRSEGPRLSSLRVMASEEGAPLPAIWGRMRIAGQVIWATNLLEVQQTTTTEQSSKGGAGAGGGTENTSYSYFANFAVGLCEGEIDSIGRVWADGREVDISSFTSRLYRGTETQNADSLITAVEGTAPAYRGLAYIVFERLPLADFGNRIPQLSFEVIRSGNGTANLIKAMCIIPGSTEFGYDTVRVARNAGEGETATENAHVSSERTDWSVSIDQLQDTCRNFDSASLIVAWFGNDLRCGQCQLRPGVDTIDKVTTGASWRVSDVTRSTAYEVSRVGGAPAFGGTPSDASVTRAILDLKARGLKVVFYPFILMDVPQGNSLPDPYGGTAQAPYPWRGRMTASVAPGLPGTPDKTATAAAQIANFVGTCAPGHFASAGGEIVYSGPNEWSFRRLILHYATLCASAGGVDAFMIGSEMRGLSTLRGSGNSFPFVAALQALAAEVKAILPTSRVGYGADWSEYFGHQPGDGTGDVFFHLDPLWASPAIDFIGIDNYMPLSDWRDGSTHLDASAGSIYNLDYLKAGIASGEGFDWYYASTTDRQNQQRTTISDGAYGKPWIYRFKDLKNWWANPHHDRPGGVENVAATAWVPQSKPFWFTELGCPAVDKGTNQPNVFVDEKSVESALPYFSSGARDDTMQNRYIRAMQDYWDAPGIHNPPSTEYAGRMVDSSRMFYWAWDARPFPQFPGLTDVWSDGVNYARGHWLNGRLGSVDLGQLIAVLCQRFGLAEVNAAAVAGQLDGFLVDRPMSGREALESLLRAFSVDAVESGDVLKFLPRQVLQAIVIGTDELADNGAAPLSATRAQEHDLPQAVRLGFTESALDYRTGAVWQARSEAHSNREISLTLPAAVSHAQAQARADILLEEAWQQRSSARFALPPQFLALEPGDVVNVDGRSWRISSIADGAERRVEAVSHDAALYEAWVDGARDGPVAVQPHYGPPDVLFMDLAMARGPVETAPWIAARANPWPSRLSVLRQSDDASFAFIRTLTAQATMGSTQTALPQGIVDRIDHTHTLDVKLAYGALSSVSELQLLNGANAAAIGNASAGYEILQFQTATLVAANTYRLSGLLRGLEGSQAEMLATRPAGSRFVLLNAAVVQPSVTLNEATLDSTWRVGPSQLDHGHESYAQRNLGPTLKALRPLAPVRLKSLSDGSGVALNWIRQARVNADGWELEDVPLGESTEKYRVTILDGATVKRTVDVAVPEWLYTVAAMTADFGSMPVNFTVRVQQVSAATGAGTKTEKVIYV